MINKIILIFICTIALSISSCRVKKAASLPNQATEQVSEEELLKKSIVAKLFATGFDYHFLTAKAKVKVTREGKDFSLTFNIRSEKDKQIWISANAIGGIEVARVLMNKDSIRILDRFNKQYIVKDYQYLSELLKTPVDFYLLQDLMFGEAPRGINYQESSLMQSESSYLFSGILNTINYNLNIRKEDYKTQNIVLADFENKKRKVEVNYGGFKIFEGYNFPYLISSVASSQKESLSLNLEYVKVEKVNNLEFPFTIPKKFD